MRIRWNSCVGALIGFVCLMGSYVPGFAKEIAVEELSISLYNKPVTGFRFTLERSERFVANQVIAHVAAVEQTPPFQYERSIIYENIRYAPIADDRDLSLYFLLKSIQGQFTELTVVVMYDYRRALNSREFPELATLLKIDIAKLIRETSGDIARFGDLLLDEAAIAKMEAGPVGKDAPLQPPVAEHFKSEEVENESVFLRRDPFKNDNRQPADNKAQVQDTTLQRLNARIRALEAREAQLIAEAETQRTEQASLQRKNDILTAKLKETKRLQDSVTMLNERVEALIGQSYVADDMSVSNETATEMAELEKENRRLTRLHARLEEENDSLLGIAIRYSEQLTRLSAGGKSSAEQMAQVTRENENLRIELQEYKTKLAMGLSEGQGMSGTAAADSLIDLLAQAQVKNISLRDEAEVRERNLGRLKEDNDYLNGKKMQLEERITSLEAENRNLRAGNAEVIANLPNENLIDSLNGEIRTARRAAGTAKAELAQTKADMETLQQQKDEQERQLVAAQTQEKNLQAKIAILETQSGTPPTTNAGDPVADKALADSILTLKQQLARAQATAREATTAKEALTKAQADLQAKDRDMRKAQTDLATRTTELAEAQKAKSALQKSLADAEARLSANANSGSASQQEVDRLRQENKSLGNNLTAKEQQLAKATADNKMISDSAIAMRVQRTAMRRELESSERNLRLQSAARDSLQKQLSSIDSREKELKRTIMTLQSRVDSLARVRVPEGEQARFLKEQRAK
jgi:chromosome segregation ATPase